MKKFSSILLFSFIVYQAFSQHYQPDSIPYPPQSLFPDSTLVLDSIIIVGNKTTKPYVILREMSVRPGDFIMQETIEYDKKRIYSLQLFNSVEIYIEPTELPKTNLIVVVNERWYIYPIPIFGIKDRDWGKFFYGIGLMNTNFRGRNEKVYVTGTLGYEPTFNVYYKNPEISNSKDLILETSFGYSRGENKSRVAKYMSGDYWQHFISLSVSLGKRFGNFHTLYGTAAYQIVKVSEARFGRLLNPWSQDAYPVLAIGYRYDTRDLNDYTLSGTFLNIQASKYGLFLPNIDYWRYNLDYRRFIPMIPHIVLAVRSFTNISGGGNIPNYNHLYFGYNERIRGHFSELYEGENIFGASGELRLIILEPRYISFDGIFMPEFSVWKFGIAAALFGDAGTTWYRRQPFALDNLIKGYGGGLHFMLPYGFVFRAEYALNEYRKGEFIFDLTAAF
jgi:outer membrane protein assembly factor BamA